MHDLKFFNDEELLTGYVIEAAWFWFDASTTEMSLEAGLHRVAAHCLRTELRQRGVIEPGGSHVYAHARRAFPPDDLRRFNN